ncbi:MAG TPA: lysophospholipid acyltransferase family protein [Spirochaetota bacterium]|nr:lysophospholipid acyltransferase family protein [Spirochaetota bacterium]HPI87691.1 lysophospholipid acyltransferase family protein [Spirochaetota bacterium]HPR48184.1 lysophospholipid acyltransferase family protein [Spirochaetota bacterium]
MIAVFHDFVVRVSGLLGPWFFSVMAWLIATGYFCLIPARVVASSRVYRALYPERSRLFHIRCVWRQYQSFTRVILDRMLLLNYGNINFSSHGWEHLVRAGKEGRGGVIVMSHMGNWDVAAHLLRKEGIPLMIFMGAKDREQLEKRQKDDLSERGIRIVAVGKDGGSPLDIIEGLSFVRRGGFVALTGDLLWNRSQRSVEAQFLGRPVKLPVAPYILAMKAGAPLLFFFAFRNGPGSYSFSISETLRLPRARGDAADEAVRNAAQHYADVLTARLREHPFQWYHFKDFFAQ